LAASSSARAHCRIARSTVCEARAYATQDGVETLIATMSGTLMALAAREQAPKDRAPVPV
jgi:hypothetical protein